MISDDVRNVLLDTAKRHKSAATSAVITILLRSAGEVSPALSKVSGWILGITGATFSLALSNAEQTQAIISGDNLRNFIALLCVSAAFGSLAIARGVHVEIAKTIYERILRDGNARDAEVEGEESFQYLRKLALENGVPFDTAPDVEFALETYIHSFPWFMRRRLKRVQRAALADEFHAHRQITVSTVWQSGWLGLQFLTVVVAAVYVAFSTH